MARTSVPRYSRFVLLSLLAFETVSMALLLGWIYLILTRSYTQEFQRSLDMETAQIQLSLQERLNFAMDRLRSCAMNNALRVSLMLGLSQQIDEHLRQHYTPKGSGIHIFVQDAETGRVYGMPQDGDMVSLQLSEEHVSSFFAFGPKIFPFFLSNHCLFVATWPIQRKNELLGTALLIYNIQGDSRFGSLYRPGTAPVLGFWKGFNFVDVLTGNEISGRFIQRDKIGPLSLLKLSTKPSYTTLPLRKTEFGLHAAFSLEPLSQRFFTLLQTFGLLFLVVLGATCLVGFLIYRRMHDPLQSLLHHTEQLASNPSPHFIEEEKIPFWEFRTFAASFNTMLRSFLELQRRFAERAEEKLKASEERYQELVETLPIGIVTLDAGGRFLFANPAALFIMGYEPQELKTLTLQQVMAFKRSVSDSMEATWNSRAGRQSSSPLMTPGHNETSEPPLKDMSGPFPGCLSETDAAEGPLEADLRRPDGRTVRVETYFRATRVGPEDVLLLTFFDVTQRKTAEESRRRFMTAIEQVPEPIIITDKDRRVVYANPAFETVFGYDPKAVIGQDMRSLVGTSQSQWAYAQVEQALRHGQTWKGLLVNRTASGAEIETRTSITPIKDEDGELKYIVYVKRDVTEEQQLERRLRQTQKLQAIGTLAGGIAHDFNNILMIILGNAQMAMRLAQNEKVHRPLERILQASQRASDMVRQILTFSRSEDRPFQSVRLKSVVQEALQLLRGSLPATIRMETHLDVTDDLVFGDATQLHQVIMNLGTNAAYAMRDAHGLLSVSLREEDLSEPRLAQALGVAPGMYLCLSVTDTGPGIPPDLLDRIFEPFFTTKPLGEGTGLGLSVVHGIVRTHKGGIDVHSEPGKGTTFRVYLPKGAAARTDPVMDKNRIRVASKRILVVDDEEMVREVLTDLLTAEAHHVTAAASAQDAIELLASPETPPFDLILVDQTMPHMTGLEFLAKIREYGNQVPAVLCSGNPQDVSPEIKRSLSIHGVLTKPFSVDMLHAVLAQLFGSESHSL
ncbi:PAS domain S-box protein [Desulfosoma caldarium]|uniref:histidine kinase n=1 Tax=Desulfosoma caldarium TaxID=610254 RepID=A0A3N1VFP3_9BACT|nr:PAS domain S-box protein [Desulfosoma caldarium]ROR01695.1 PAS domain S-box-containing protein [Desulfosoma caldarium]